MRKKATRKRPYFTMESAMTAILRDASEKMHHGILIRSSSALASQTSNALPDLRLGVNVNLNLSNECDSVHN